MFCDKTGTLTENNMVFCRCTIDGIDYDHTPVAAAAAAAGSAASAASAASGDDGSAGKGGGRRASLEPNPKLAHTLSLTASQVVGDFKRAQKVQEFFLLLAVCNTVIVAKQPHRDNMNASGFICSSAPCVPASASSSAKVNRRFRRKENSKVTIAPATSDQQEESKQKQEEPKDETDQRLGQTPSPPLSLTSTSSSTAPLQPGFPSTPSFPVASASANLLRPNRLLPVDQSGFPCSTKPALSPIASSPEITPTAEQMQHQASASMAHTAPATPVSVKTRALQLPALLNRLVSPTPNSSRTTTPLPTVRICTVLTTTVKPAQVGKVESREIFTCPNKNMKKYISNCQPGPESSKPLYEAESPDELALVDAAHAYDIRLLKRTPNKMVLSTPGDYLLELEILHILPFDSVRKRMSVILLHPVTKEKVLYCKGADSSIFPRLRAQEGEEVQVLEKTKAHLDAYARLGLRVLVMAKRVISDAEYKIWSRAHSEAEVRIYLNLLIQM